MNKPFFLDTDASDIGAGAVLEQEKDGTRRPIGFFSRHWSPAQRNYSTLERELCAIVLAMEHFHYLVLGHDVTVFSDHQPLSWVASAKKLNSRCYIDKNHSNWDELLPFLCFAYNTSIHASTNLTPYEVLFGRTPKIPLDLVLGSSLSMDETGSASLRKDGRDVVDEDEAQLRAIDALPEKQDIHPFAQQLKERLSQVYEHVVEQRAGRVAKQKFYYERKLFPFKYKVGDLVYYMNHKPERQKAKKLLMKWVGPYRVVAVLSDVTYTIKSLVENGHATTVHHNNLKRFFGPDPSAIEHPNQIDTTSGIGSEVAPTGEPDDEFVLMSSSTAQTLSEDISDPVAMAVPIMMTGNSELPRKRGRPRTRPEPVLAPENPSRVGGRERRPPERLDYA